MSRNRKSNEELLNEIFNGSKELSHGRFRVKKSLSQDWEQAQIFADDVEIEVGSNEKKLFTLLVFMRGDKVSLRSFSMIVKGIESITDKNLESTVNVFQATLSKLKKGFKEKGLEDLTELFLRVRGKKSEPEYEKYTGCMLARDEEHKTQILEIPKPV